MPGAHRAVAAGTAAHERQDRQTSRGNDDGLPTLLNFLAHGEGSPITGLLGGRGGAGAGFAVTGGTLQPANETSTLVELQRAGDALALWSAGGSGFGDPRERADDVVARDLAEGYLTLEGLAPYGREHAPQRSASTPDRARPPAPRA